MLEKAILKRGSFSNDVLFGLSHWGIASSDSLLWREILVLWERRNGPVHERFESLVQQSRLDEADSLFSAFHAGKRLDSFELLKWINVKAVLNRYEAAARLACAISLTQPRRMALAHHSLQKIIDDRSREIQKRVLAEYEHCMMKGGNSDTLRLRSWLSTMYGRLGFYDEEIDVLLRLETINAPIENDLLRIAQRYLMLRRYEQASRAAAEAYTRLSREQVRSKCAIILFQLYRQRGMLDSALFWIDKTDMNSLAIREQAVVVYQQTGLLQQADSCIGTFPRGFDRDTLTLRQMLFSSDTTDIVPVVAEMSSSRPWQRHSEAASLWRARAALFSGHTDTLKNVLDSAGSLGNHPFANELLRYRYMTQRFGNNSPAMRRYALLARAQYTHNLDLIRRQLDNPSFFSPPAGPHLSLEVAKTFIERGDYDAAARSIALTDSSDRSAQQWYYAAEIAFRKSDYETARHYIEYLVLHFPHDIFSNKAELLLHKIAPE
jgi:tetratricopeptide (TPR) repeat protein